MNETIKLFVKKVLFYNKENGYAVLVGQTQEMRDLEAKAPKTKGRRDFSKPDAFSFTLNGILEEEGDLENVEIEVEGKRVTHAKYGETFKFSSIKIIEDPMYFFLTKVIKGIRKTTARSIVQKYTEEELADILSNRPSELLKFNGIAKTSLEKIQESWAKHAILKDFSKALSPFGASVSMVRRVYEQFNGDPKKADEIQKNPYLLTDTTGIGFKKADSVARTMGVNHNDSKRLIAAIEFVVKELTENKGDTLLQKSDLFNNITTIASFEDVSHHLQIVDEGALNKAFDALVESKKLIAFKNNWFTSTSIAKNEKFILDNLRERNLKQKQIKSDEDLESWISQRERSLDIVLSDQQKEAIRKVNKGNHAFALCGDAGTGKSTISRLILELLEELPEVKEEDCVCCALSGIAADRIRNTTGKESMTVASLLLQYEIKGNKYKKKVVLVDESSMINTSTLAELLSSIPIDSYVLLVGDPAQLPPIGAGAPFSDIINNTIIPNVELTQIYRQSEDAVITTFANSIRKGEMPEEIDGIYEDFVWLDHSLNNYFALKSDVEKGIIPIRYFEDLKRNNRFAIQHSIAELAITKMSEMRTYMATANWNKYLKSFQIICPIKKGELGVNELNNICQNLNTKTTHEQALLAGKKPNIVSFGDFNLYRFDKVVHIKNDNFKYLTKEDMRSGESTFETLEG